MKFSFDVPTKIIFGVNSSLEIHKLLDKLDLKKVFVVAGKSFSKTKYFEKIVFNLRQKNFDVTVFTDIIPEPTIQVVDEASMELKNSNCDVVVAVGGGSTIDICKAMCMLQNNEGSIKEYLFGGNRRVENKPLPLIAVPTTAGSGSEVTGASVVSDEENNVKLSVTDPSLIPQFAILDPATQLDMPQLITSSTGMDALTHAIEAYVSKNASIISDSYAEKAIQLIGENIYTATFTTCDIEARSKMAIASTLAAVAFANAGLGAVHGISQAMGGVAHVPHGIANSMLLPPVIKKNMFGDLKKFSKIAELLGQKVEGLTYREGALKCAARIKEMSLDLKIPCKFSEVNVEEDMFSKIVEGTMDYRMLSLNPVKLEKKDIYEILDELI
ncbi:MAG: iron-containing alcohol dehydrogenase [Clostridium sp.]|jgi:alcohol dehydrogenase class IV|uniref:iron-containing alcohol dehydrogenase n=3 Tax=Clostridium sp. TaxID=1506 RepID=UPI0025BD009A|nr:iron-containing alcohol dehydrogenase [Clostridium sp.]MCH3964450.1 iron-containing alcohol dehydrogenase [Clostridium sp.]MCI1715625.1 iron-containing alcohol dehydrogenase [Clostridium sp.]MCI1799583.1 iron-containing alcohol dehydrogenase [Clostridium sp.]MCI1813809.1 iron-containing alcohol dehydrogenase [Clostridium sp.]MCI1870396.1 iron-containing alcohol dehydrogenase [Clostridium sp.]